MIYFFPMEIVKNLYISALLTNDLASYCLAKGEKVSNRLYLLFFLPSSWVQDVSDSTCRL